MVNGMAEPMKTERVSRYSPVTEKSWSSKKYRGHRLKSLVPWCLGIGLGVVLESPSMATKAIYSLTRHSPRKRHCPFSGPMNSKVCPLKKAA